MEGAGGFVPLGQEGMEQEGQGRVTLLSVCSNMNGRPSRGSPHCWRQEFGQQS